MSASSTFFSDEKATLSLAFRICKVWGIKEDLYALRDLIEEGKHIMILMVVFASLIAL
jgi:hypothetical protein